MSHGVNPASYPKLFWDLKTSVNGRRPNRHNLANFIEMTEWIQYQIDNGFISISTSSEQPFITAGNALHRKSDHTLSEADVNTVHLGGELEETTTIDGAYESGVKAGFNFTIFNTVKNQIHSVSEAIIGVGDWDAGFGLYPAAYDDSHIRFQANGNQSQYAKSLWGVQADVTATIASPIIYLASSNLAQMDSINTIINATGTLQLVIGGSGGGNGDLLHSDGATTNYWGPLTAEFFPTYANDAAAGVGGLSQYAVYKTASGELRYKL